MLTHLQSVVSHLITDVIHLISFVIHLITVVSFSSTVDVIWVIVLFIEVFKNASFLSDSILNVKFNPELFRNAAPIWLVVSVYIRRTFNV